MFIEFKQRELKKDSLEFNDITFLYLLSIKEQNPLLWETFFKLISKINNYPKEVLK